MQHFASTETFSSSSHKLTRESSAWLGAGRKHGRAEHGDTHPRRAWRQQGCAGLDADPSPKASASCGSGKPEAEGSTGRKEPGRSLAGHWSRQQHSCLLRDLSRLQTCPGTSLTNTAQFQFLALVLPRWLWDFFLGNQRSQEDNKCPSHTRLPCCSTTPTPH